MSFEQLVERQLEDALPLQREAGLDWGDVLQRAGYRRGRPRRWLVVAAALLVLGVPSAYTAVPGVIGYFDDGGEAVPLERLSERDRRTLGLADASASSVAVEEIGNDGRRAYYKIQRPEGSACLASGPANGSDRFGSIVCGEGLVPTPERPITTDVVTEATRADPALRIWRVTGLVGAGIERVALVDTHGRGVATEVAGNVYTLGPGLPRREYLELVAFDAEGKVVYRERVAVPRAR